MDERLRKTINLPNDIRTYIYSGHGEDVCDPETHQVITHIVPDNCIYITIEMCGKLVFTSTPRNAHLFSTDDATFLKYPYLSLFNPKLAQILDIKNINLLTVRLPGQTYAASYFFPFAFWYDDRHKYMNYSGLCDKRDLERNEAIMERTMFREAPGKKYPKIVKEEIIRKYSASSYPTMESVRNALRTIPEEYQPNSLLDGQKYLDRITREIEQEYGFYHDVSRKDGPDAFFSNTYLMEKFPGIHYNIICRDVNCVNNREASELAKGRRRLNSEIQLQNFLPILNTPEFTWAILDKIEATENDTFKAAIADYVRSFKQLNPRA